MPEIAQDVQDRLISLRQHSFSRVVIGNALVDNCTSRQVCRHIIQYAEDRRPPAYVITPNAQHIVLLEQDERFRRIYQRADLVLPDGVSLLFAARVHGSSLIERIAGVDIFKDLCGLAAERNLRVFLLGGRPGSAELAAGVLRKITPNLDLVSYCPPLCFEQDPRELEAVADAVRRAQPHLLFVGLGAPKQEFWIHDHGLVLGVPILIGVGGSFEMVGGVISRAPRWVQEVACEWLYRLLQEPKRMWRRYLIGNVLFANIILRQHIRRVFLRVLLNLTARLRFGAELSELTDAEQASIAALSTALPSDRQRETQNSIAA